MLRYAISCLFILAIICGAGYYFFTDFWEQRFDELVTRQSRVYNVDESLVWSLIYEETYFRGQAEGNAGEIGLMQVTPLVAREWAKTTGLSDFERQANERVDVLLKNPERNIQIGCWYLDKVRSAYRGRPAETAMMLSAYNAGASRVEEWTQNANTATMTESEFISRIGIESTKNYVTNILQRYRLRQVKESK